MLVRPNTSSTMQRWRSVAGGVAMRWSQQGEGTYGLRGLMMFDLDGTLYRGDDPFRYYAHVVSQHMDPSARTLYLTQVEAHLGGDPHVIDADTWQAVVRLAAPYVTDPEVCQQAFVPTRQYMLSPECQMDIAPELKPFLAKARERMFLALVSNSAEEAAIPLLQKLDLLDAFEVVRTAVGKPTGLLETADRLILQHDLNASVVMSIGDNYANDIAPALERGWTTVHVSPHGHFPGPSTYQVRQVEEAFPAMWQWAEEWT